jgi:hypothetical protein
MKKFFLFFAAIAFFAVSSCTKEQDVESFSSNSDVKSMLTVLKESGVNLDKVVVNEKLKCFIIEGDIAIDFKSIPEIKACLLKKSSDTKKAYQYPNPYYATLSAVSTIDIYVDPSVGVNGWSSAVQSAVDAWNSISPNCAVQMTLTTNSSLADMKISTFFENSGTVALGNGCLNGEVGKFININTNYNTLDASTKINTIVHELGHTIGLAHTNGQSNFSTPILVEGTSSYNDPNAVMYPYIHSWYGFSVDEIKALKTLYHKSTEVVFEVNVYGPVKAKAGVNCSYRAIVNGGSAVKYEWVALDDRGIIIKTGRDSTFSAVMPTNCNLTVRLKVNSSDGKVEMSDDWVTYNANPAVGY